MAERLTLEGIMASLDGDYYDSRKDFEAAVCARVINPNIGLLPIGFTYQDAIAGAVENGWLKTNPDGAPGITVDLTEVPTA